MFCNYKNWNISDRRCIDEDSCSVGVLCAGRLVFLVVLILSMWFASWGNCVDLEKRKNMRKLANLNLTLLPLR